MSLIIVQRTRQQIIISYIGESDAIFPDTSFDVTRGKQVLVLIHVVIKII